MCNRIVALPVPDSTQRAEEQALRREAVLLVADLPVDRLPEVVDLLRPLLLARQVGGRTDNGR